MKQVVSGDILSLPSLITYMVHGLHDILTVQIVVTVRDIVDWCKMLKG